jgi:hypothetical protein
MKMSIPVSIIVAGILIGGAILLSSYLFAPKYALVKNSSGVFMRINTRTGNSRVCIEQRKSDDNGQLMYLLTCDGKL